MKYFDKGANTIFIHIDKQRSRKSVLYSLKRKGFISNYKDKHNNNIKGCYVIK
jgi:hypothetical protein